MSYVPLWCKSHFSFLEGASRPDELVEQAHAFGLRVRCARLDAGSFRQVVWTDADADPRRGLPSDHCLIAVDLF